MIRTAIAILLILLMSTPSSVQAQGKGAVAREMAEFVMRKFGKEVADEGVDTLSRKIEAVIVKYGDDGAKAVTNVGPRSFRLIEEAGEHGAESVKLMAKYGDDAIWVVGKKNRLAIFVKYGDDGAEAMIKHGEFAEPLIEKFGQPAARALKGVSEQSARRIAMLAEDGDLKKIGRTPELLGVVSQYSDAAMNFIWKNKVSLAVAATLASFLADPEPFIDGTLDLAGIVATSAIQPMAVEAGKRTNWTAVIVSIVAVVAGLLAFRVWLRSPRRGARTT